MNDKHFLGDSWWFPSVNPRGWRAADGIADPNEMIMYLVAFTLIKQSRRWIGIDLLSNISWLRNGKMIVDEKKNRYNRDYRVFWYVEVVKDVSSLTFSPHNIVVFWKMEEQKSSTGCCGKSIIRWGTISKLWVFFACQTRSQLLTTNSLCAKRAWQLYCGFLYL